MNSSVFEVSIGGIRYSTDVAPRLRLFEDDPTYRDFVNAESPMRGEVLVPVALELGGAPRLEASDRVFDAGTWSAFRTTGETILRLRATQGRDSYLWTARVRSESGQDRVTVHCGDLLVDRHAGEVHVRSPLHYPLDQLLTMHVLAPRRGLVCHAAGIAVDGRGALFAGRSGAGKTTFTRLCAGRPEIAGLSDDRVVIRSVEGAMRLYGTPWAGEGRVASNRSCPLAALVFLHKGEGNELRPIAPRQALEQLFPVLSILWFDRDRMERATSFCGELVETVPAYELHFRPEPAALDLLPEIF